MKNILYLGAFIMLAILGMSPLHAATDGPEAAALVKSLLPTEDEYLAFIKDETQKAKMKTAIAATENACKVDAFWAPENKWYRILYGCFIKDGTIFGSMMTVTKDDEEFKKVISAISQDFKDKALQYSLKLVPIDAGKNATVNAEYYRILDETGNYAGNVLLVSRGRSFMLVTIIGPAVFESAEDIDKFFSGKIEKAFAYQPDEKSPNFPNASR